MDDSPFPVLIFAAGFGTRMKALTRDKPKPMISVGGQPLIDHALHWIDAIRPPRVVANLHYKPDVLKAHLAPRNVTCVVESPDILETGGGLRNALPLLGPGPVITMNSDAVWAGPNPLRHLLDHWEPEKMDALLMCIPRQNAAGHAGQGDFTHMPDGCLQRGPGLIYGGAQIMKPDLLAKISEKTFSLNVVWDAIRENGRLHGLTYDGKWCDVGHPEGILLAEALLDRADV